MTFYGALFGWEFDVGPAEFGHYTQCLLQGSQHLHVTADAFLVDRFYVALSDGAPRSSPRSPSKNRSASRRSGRRSGTIWDSSTARSATW